MSVSRKSPGDEGDYEMTVADYMADKAECQDRTGYAPRTEEELAQKAVDEKLLSGSQSY